MIPRSYQWVGTEFLTGRPGAILGDQMGLGKTATAILSVIQLGAKTVLVTCPKNLKGWWVKEITNVEQAFGSNIVFDDVELTKPVPRVHVRGEVNRTYYLSHYEQFRGKQTAQPITKQLLAEHYQAHIVDEVHKIKNRKAQRTKWILRVSADYRWGLTGTPVAEFPQDLWTLLHWVAPHKFQNFYHYVAMYCEMAWNFYSGKKEVVGVTEAGRRMLRQDTAPYLLVRTLEDVGVQLPSITVTDIPLQLEPDHQKFYNRVRKEIVIDLHNNHVNLWDLKPQDEQLIITTAGARFTRLHQVCSNPGVFQQKVEDAKLQWLRDYIEGGGSPAVILSRYNHTVGGINEVLQELGQGQGQGDYIVGTFASLSTGHNFQHLHTLIAWDMTYSRLEWEQAKARVHRLGQTKPVQILRLGYTGTVDMDVQKLIDNKQEVVQMLNVWLRGLRD